MHEPLPGIRRRVKFQLELNKCIYKLILHVMIGFDQGFDKRNKHLLALLSRNNTDLPAIRLNYIH